jgi:hypothetical protein
MAKKNIKIGPTIQVMKNETNNNFLLLNKVEIFSNFTLVSGGYIININPIAKGILVVPFENELMKLADDGIK